MNISEMSDQDKSVMLARLAGFSVLNTVSGEPRRVFCDPYGSQVGGSLYYIVAKNLTKADEFKVLCPDFYNPANMALLAIAISWLAGVSHWEPHIGKWAKFMQHLTDGMTPMHLHKWMCKSADAGIGLAIEAGLIQDAPN
jgi:hypothetical protein